jgi:hypothetical protein
LPPGNDPCGHEQQIRQPIDIGQPRPGQRLDCIQLLTTALGATGQAAADVGLGDQRRATGQDEIFQRAQFLVPQVDRRFQPLDFRHAQGLVSRHRQFTTQIEQPVLTRRQHRDDFLQRRMPGRFLG